MAYSGRRPGLTKLDIAARGLYRGDSRYWPTPNTVNRTSQRAKYGRPTSGPSRGGPSFGLEEVVLGPTSIAQPAGRLNPRWVECLMGFPLDWTEVEGSR
jgi:hypothetical protein